MKCINHIIQAPAALHDFYTSNPHFLAKFFLLFGCYIHVPLRVAHAALADYYTILLYRFFYNNPSGSRYIKVLKRAFAKVFAFLHL